MHKISGARDIVKVFVDATCCLHFSHQYLSFPSKISGEQNDSRHLSRRIGFPENPNVSPIEEKKFDTNDRLLREGEFDSEEIWTERSRKLSSLIKTELHCMHLTSDFNKPPKLLLIMLSISEEDIELFADLAAIRDDFRGLFVIDGALFDDNGDLSSS